MRGGCGRVARWLPTAALAGVLGTVVNSTLARAQPAPPPEPVGAAAFLAQMPDDIDGAIGVVGLGRLVSAAGAKPPGALAVAATLAAFSPESFAAWAAFSQQMGWTGAEAADRLIGGGAVLVWKQSVKGGAGPADEAGAEPPGAWAVVTEITPETDRALRAKLRVVPRTMVRGRAVLAVEGGHLLFASGPERAANAGPGNPAERRVLACLLPADQDGLLDRLAPVLNGEPGGLGNTVAMRQLDAHRAAPVAAVLRLEHAQGEPAWARYATVAAWSERGSGRVAAWIDAGAALDGLRGVPITGDVLAAPGASADPRDDPGKDRVAGAAAGTAADEVIAVAFEPEADLPRAWTILRPGGLVVSVIGEATGRAGERPERLAAPERSALVKREGRGVGLGLTTGLRGEGAAAGDRLVNMLLDAAGRKQGAEFGEDVFGFDGLLPDAERRERARVNMSTGERAEWTAVWRTVRTEGGGGVLRLGLSARGEATARELGREAAALQAAVSQPPAGDGARAWVSRGAVWPRRAAGAAVWPPPVMVAVHAVDVERLTWGVWRDGHLVRVEVGVERE